VVEWSQYIKPDLPDDVLEIVFERVPNYDTKRVITLTASGEKSVALLSEMEK
jgi:tRNA threonylcarbamoyladenosine biosynthesis protein TsaE